MGAGSLITAKGSTPGLTYLDPELKPNSEMELTIGGLQPQIDADTLPPANMKVHRLLQKDNFPFGTGLFALPC